MGDVLHSVPQEDAALGGERRERPAVHAVRVTEDCRIALLTWAVSQFQKVSRNITVSAFYFIIINFALVGSETRFSVLGPVAPAILKSSLN